MIVRSSMLLISLALAAPAVQADEAAPAAQSCPTKPVLPSEWKGWEKITALKTMSKLYGRGVDQWPPFADKRTGLALHPIANVKYWATPGKAILAQTYGGMNTVKVSKAGRLKIALDEGAWIDLVGDGTIIPSVAHGHGAECSGIRKIVEFDVTPGTYVVQFVNAPHGAIRAMAIVTD